MLKCLAAKFRVMIGSLGSKPGVSLRFVERCHEPIPFCDAELRQCYWLKLWLSCLPRIEMEQSYKTLISRRFFCNRWRFTARSVVRPRLRSCAYSGTQPIPKPKLWVRHPLELEMDSWHPQTEKCRLCAVCQKVFPKGTTLLIHGFRALARRNVEISRCTSSTPAVSGRLSIWIIA